MKKSKDIIIEEIYVKYSKSIFAKCLNFFRNEDLAKDAVQDVFIKAYENLDRFKLKESYLPWLYKIANNHCYNVLKRNSVYKKALSEIKKEQLSLNNSPSKLSSENKELLRFLIRRTDEKTAQIIISYYFDGMNKNEIADLLSISRKTVAKKISLFLDGSKKYITEPEF